MKLQTNNAVLALTLSTKECSYWRNEGQYQHAYDAQFHDLVPACGEADSVHGVLLRAAARIYYDIHNNGGGNMVDNIHGDWSDEEPEYELTDAFKTFFTELETWMPIEHKECISKVKALVLEGHGNANVYYDHMLDRVTHTTLTTKNIVHADT